jgi:hypothetical protein
MLQRYRVFSFLLMYGFRCIYLCRLVLLDVYGVLYALMPRISYVKGIYPTQLNAT